MRVRVLRESWLAIGSALLALGGCAVPAQLRYEREVEDTAPAALHGVHTQRLVELMRGLERLRNERLPTAMDVAGAETAREREIEQVSRSLAASARAIPAVAADAPMSDEDRQAFLRMAADLERAATQLGASPARSPDGLREQVQQIETTCQSCHRRFRIAGELDAP
jgi:cytochrome c556